jgi:hypothetical protein
MKWGQFFDFSQLIIYPQTANAFPTDLSTAWKQEKVFTSIQNLAKPLQALWLRDL